MVSGINLWVSINKFQSQPTRVFMQTTSSATHNRPQHDATVIKCASALVVRDGSTEASVLDFESCKVIICKTYTREHDYSVACILKLVRDRFVG